MAKQQDPYSSDPYGPADPVSPPNPNLGTTNAGGSISSRPFGFTSNNNAFRQSTSGPESSSGTTSEPSLSPGIQAAQSIIGSGSYRNKGTTSTGQFLAGGLGYALGGPLGAVGGFAGTKVLGNAFGANNASAIQDIAAAISRGQTITDAQWRQAGYGPGGTELSAAPATTAPAPSSGSSPLANVGVVPLPSAPKVNVPSATAAPAAAQIFFR